MQPEIDDDEFMQLADGDKPLKSWSSDEENDDMLMIDPTTP